MIPEHKLDPDPEPPTCTKCDGNGNLSLCCNAPIGTTMYGEYCHKCGKACETEHCSKCDGNGVLLNE